MRGICSCFFLLCLITAPRAALCEGDIEQGAVQEELPQFLVSVNVVEAARPEWEQVLSHGAVNVIIPDDFKGEQKKLPEYLDMVPGLHVERRGGEGQYAAVTMRGSSGAQVNIYVDGVPQNLGLDGAIDLSLIPMHNVARIEVYRGYVPVRFSGAPIGGVINIVTKKPQGFGFNISAGAKSLAGRLSDVTVTAPLFGGSLLLGFHHDRGKGDFGYTYTPPDKERYPSCGTYTPCERERKSNSHKNTDVLIKWQNENWHFKWAWKETGRFHPNETNLQTSTGYESIIDIERNLMGPYYPGYQTYHRYQKAAQNEFLLGRRQVWGNLVWGVEANWIKQDKSYEIKDFTWRPDLFDTAYANRAGSIWNRYDTTRFGVNLDGAYKLGDRQLLELRVDFYNEKLEMDGNKRQSLESGGYNNENGAALNYKRNAWHVQISDTFNLNESKDLRITLTARWDSARDGANLDNRWFSGAANASDSGSWGIALKKDVGESWTFRSAGGSYVRYPNFYEIYGDGVYVVPSMASPDAYSIPERETGYQWDFGGDWRGKLLNARASLSATWFGRLTDKQIYPLYNPLYGTIQYGNVGVVKAQGAEFEGALQWSRVDVNGAATWQRTILVKDLPLLRGLFRVREGNPLTLQPDWETYIRGEYRLPGRRRLSLFAEHQYTGSMLESWVTDLNAPEVRRSAMNVTGIGARYRTPWGFTLVTGVDDVFNQRPGQKFTWPNRILDEMITQMAVFPSPGRTWYVTLDYLYGRGSATDSTGAGSADSLLAGKIAEIPPLVNAQSAGVVPARKRFYYIAPKMIYVNQKAEMAERGVETRPVFTSPDSGQPYLPLEYTGQLTPYPGASRRGSYLTGGLALGVDLYDRFNIPLRIELEASLPHHETAQNMEIIHPGYRREGFPENTEPGLSLIWGEKSAPNNWSQYTFGYRTHAVSQGLYYDFHNGTRFTPYLGAGVGMSFTKTYGYTFFRENTYIINIGGINTQVGASINMEEGERERHFAWNTSVGVSYSLTDNMDIDLSYRYVNTGFSGRKGPQYEYWVNQFGAAPNPDGQYLYSIKFQAPALDLRRQNQIVIGLRYGF